MLEYWMLSRQKQPLEKKKKWTYMAPQIGIHLFTAAQFNKEGKVAM